MPFSTLSRTGQLHTQLVVSLRLQVVECDDLVHHWKRESAEPFSLRPVMFLKPERLLLQGELNQVFIKQCLGDIKR